MRHAAADDDALRREHQHQGRRHLADVVAGELRRLGLAAGVQQLQARPVAVGEGRAARHTLGTPPVVGAAARVVVVRVPLDEDVAHLGVEQAVDGAAVEDRAAADPGADGEVDDRADPLPRAPALLGQRGAVDVGVPAHGQPEPLPEAAHHVGVAPARLGRRRDPAVCRVPLVQAHRPERRDAERGRLLPRVEPPLDPVADGAERLVGARRGDHRALAQVLRSRPDGAHDLGAAHLDPCHGPRPGALRRRHGTTVHAARAVTLSDPGRSCGAITTRSFKWRQILATLEGWTGPDMTLRSSTSTA